MPKMYSLYSEASILPRRSSHARKRRLESWLSVNFDIWIVVLAALVSLTFAALQYTAGAWSATGTIRAMRSIT